MNVRKNLPLIVGGSIGLILVLAALGLLIKFQREFGKATSSLKGEQNRLESLRSRRPFPKEENVKLVNANLERVTRFKEEVLKAYRAGDVEVKTIEPAEFPPLLEKVANSLYQKAKASDVILSEKMDFGFSRYIQGELPDQDNMDRLVYQVRSMQLLLDVLFDAKVKQVDSVERTVFEAAKSEAQEAPEEMVGRRSRRSRRGGEDMPSPTGMDTGDGGSAVVAVDTGEGLFTTERFKINFQTHESGLWNVLDKMASLQPFCAVKNVQISGPVPGKVQTSEAPASRNNAQGPTNQQMQEEIYEPVVIAGRESLDVALTIDFYRFPEAEQEDSEL